MAQSSGKRLADKYGPLLLAILILLSINGYAQTYNPSAHVTTNDAIGPAQATPVDSRTMFYDATNFLYRAYNGTSEVLSYLNTTASRSGHFIIVVDSGGTLQSNGTYIGGYTTYYMFKDSTTNGGLVKMNLFGSSVCSGCLLASNNLSDLANAGTARTNLGLGAMATLNSTGAGDLSGTWPLITVAKFNGQLPSYYLAYGNLTGTPAPLTLTTTGFSGNATYNSGTGVLNIPNYSGSGGSCLNCNADTIGNIPLNFTSFCNNCVLTLDSTAGYAYWAPSSGGVATLPPNSGIGFRIYSPQIPGIRSFICNSGCTIDSTSNSGALTFNITAGGPGTVTSFSSGNATGLFTTSVATATTTPAQTFALVNASAYNIWGNNTGSSSAPFYFAPNVTILNQWFGGTIQSAITLTTTGTGGPTFISNTLNIPTAVMTYTQLATTNTLNINPGNTQTFLTATDLLAGLLDTARARTIDSLHNRTFNWPVSSVSNSDGTLTISPTSGAVVASLALGHANTWAATQTFDGMTIAGAVAFSATNTWSVGGSSDVAAHMWSRIFNSDASAVLSATTGNAASLSIGINPGITLMSTGQAQFNNYTGSGFSGTANDSILTINPATGAIGWKWGQPFYIYAVQGTSPIGTTGDSVAFGGVQGAFFQPDTLYTQGQPFYIYGLPDTVATNSSDSVFILNWKHQAKLVAVSAIGGGGAVSSVADNGGGTLTISPNTGAVLAGINLASSNTWTATNTTFKNILPSANSTYNLGSNTENYNNLYVNNILPPSNLTISINPGQSFGLNINAVQKLGIASTGQASLGGYTSTSAFTGGTAVGLLGFDASGNIFPITANTNLSIIGQNLNASGGGTALNFYPNGQVGLTGPGDTVTLVDTAIKRNMGFPLWPDSTATPQLAEWSGIADNNDQLLGLPSGDTVFKAICTQTNSTGYPHINYVESYTGVAGTYVMAPNDSIISGHYRGRLFHNTSSSFATVGYYISATNVAESQIDIYINTTTGCTIAGWPSSPTHAAVVTASGLGVSFVYSSIIFINPSVTGTLYMMVDVQTTDGTYGDYLYSSTDGNAATWTLVQGFPVGLRGGRPWITKIGSTWYAWAHSVGTNSNIYSLPTDIYWFSSTNLTSWTSLGLAIPRITSNEGFNTSTGQLADIALVPRGGWVYFVATAVANGNSSGGAEFEPFSYQGTMQQLIATSQNAYPTAYIPNNGGPDANFNSHLGIGVPLTNVPWAITVRENPSAGHLGTYSDPSLVDAGNFSSSTYAPTFGFNHYKASHPVGDYLMDSTQVANWMNANNAGIGFSWSPSGSHTATANTLAVISWNATYSRPEFNAYGNILYHANADDGSSNWIQGTGAAVEFGPVTATGVNGVYIDTYRGTAAASNFTMSTTNLFSTSFTGTANTWLTGASGNTVATTANNNTALSYGNLSACTTCAFNLASGVNSLLALIDGTYNEAPSYGSWKNLQHGTGNWGLGAASGTNPTNVSYVGSLGFESLYQDTWFSTPTTADAIDSSIAIGAFTQLNAKSFVHIGGPYSYVLRVGIDDYTYAPGGFLTVPAGLGIAGWSSLKFRIPSFATTAAAGNGTTQTLTFATQLAPPFKVGQYILVQGVSPAGYIGYYRVTVCTTTTVSMLGATTGSQTVAGTVTAITTPAAGDPYTVGFSLDTFKVEGLSGAIYNVNFPSALTYGTYQPISVNSTGQIVMTGLTGPPSTYAAVVHSTAPDSGTYQVPMAYGTYTPTLTNTTNLTSSSLQQATYTRIGNIVHVNIGCLVTPTTASTATVLTVTLPITSSNGSQTNIGSSALQINSSGVSTYTSGLISIVTTTTATLSFNCTGLAGTSNVNIQFDYSL